LHQDTPLRAAIRKALVRHAVSAPLWVIRVLMGAVQSPGGLVLLVIVDITLAVIHRRANRLPEAIDWDHFGQNTSWTKALYFPETLAWVLIARDLFRTVRAL
jgi:hypothetical protein